VENEKLIHLTDIPGDVTLLEFSQHLVDLLKICFHLSSLVIDLI